MRRPKVDVCERLTIDKINTDGCINLLEAFCESLATDYKSALFTYKHDKTNKDAYEHYRNIRNLFCSEYFTDLTGLNGVAIVEKLDRCALEGY